MLYHLLHIPFTPSLKPHALSLTPQALSLKPYPLNKIKHALLLLAFLLVGVTSAMAQLHPIQLNLICPPTLPGSVNGLYQANGLKATLTLLDKYQPSLEVGVGFTMRGNGVTIEKRPDYLGETPTLLFAMPKVLGEDFFSSLLQEGVSYNGPNRDAFESKGTLTSGRYELTLWAYDLNRPAVRISNLARVYLWIQKSNPPTLTFPLDKAIVYAIPQQFSWTVAPSSNGLTTPRYKFLLYELNDPNRDPADEVMSSEPFFEEEVAAPTFSYLTYHPQLIRGKGYAWRIQAVAYDQNQQEIPLFNNNGFSAIRSFSYGQDATSTLKQLLAIEAKSKNPYSMDVKVVADPSGKMDTPDGFKLEYRKAGAEEWSQVEVDDDYTTLAKLTPNTEYELRGYPRMGALYGDAGPMVKARTQSPPEVKCGTKSSYKPDASTKLASLATGDIVTANQIPFTITAVKNSDGSFTGMAFAGVPFFGGKKLAYKLNNATFNSKYELTGGSIVADTIGIERYINKKVAEQAAKQATANEKKGDILADEKTVKVGGDIKDVTSIKVDTSDKEHPKAIVTTVDGKEQVVDIPKNGTITLADSTGEVYTASSDGTVNNIGMYAGVASGTGTMAGSVQQKPKKLYGADLLVEFQPDPQQLYGFDNPFSLGENFWKEKYDTTQVAGRTFFVPAKMVAAGATDKVVATLKGEAADHPENLSFTTTTGMRYMASPGLAKGTLQLTLAGGAPDSRQELTAWMKQGDSTVAVGRLSIDAFQSISRRVVVVPVGDATYDQAAALAEGLNGIYKQAGVRWDATVADQVLPMPEGVGESIKVDKSLFSAYSAGMRRIRSAFCSTSTYQRLGDQDIYYIFLTTLPMNGEDENAPFDGYMPYGKPFGFVRSAGMGATELAWTIAHELGHGAFQLQHVWKEQGYTTDTRNLMGYSKTGELFRWQWQDIHHPVPHNNFGADEEDLGVKEGSDLVTDIILKIRCAYATKRSTVFIGSKLRTVIGKYYYKDISVINIQLGAEKEYDSYKLFGTFTKREVNGLCKYDFGPKISIFIRKEHADNFEKIIYSGDFSMEYARLKKYLASGNSKEALNVLYNCSYCVYEKLKFNERTALLKELASRTFLQEDYEDMVLNLIRSSYKEASSAQADGILYAIMHNQVSRTIYESLKDRSAKTLFECFLKGIDNLGGNLNYTEFIKEMTNLCGVAKKTEMETARKTMVIADGRVLHPGYQYKFFDWSFLGGDDVTLENGKYTFSGYGNKMSLLPDEIVNVYFGRDFDFIPKGSSKVVAMPAFLLVYMLNYEQDALKAEVLGYIFTAINIYQSAAKVAMLKNAGWVEKSIAYMILVKEVASPILDRKDVRDASKNIKGGTTFFQYFDALKKVDATLSSSSSAIGAITKKEWIEGMLTSWDILSKEYEFKTKVGETAITEITNELLNLKSSLNDKVVY